MKKVVKNYSEEFKKEAVKKLLLPGGIIGSDKNKISKIAENMGVPTSTLFGWRKKYAMVTGMKTSKTGFNPGVPSSKTWTPEEKLAAIIETASLNQNQLGEYLRKNGLHSTALSQWKSECTSGLNPNSGPGAPRKDPEIFELRKKERALEKELVRKDKALAEMSARIILLKKSHLLWGETGEDD